MTLAGSLFQSVLRRSNPYLVPASNRRLAGWASAHPAEMARKVEAAIAAAIRYFEVRPTIDVAPLVLLGRLSRNGSERRLQFIERYLPASLAGRADPEIRWLDHTFQPPRAPEGVRKTPQHDNPVFRLMIRCLYADRNQDGVACVELLRLIDDGGGYGTTHVAIGGLMLREFSSAPEHLVEPLIQSVVPILIAVQRVDRACDLFAERIAVLQWAGHHAAVEPAWILRLVGAQQRDGGWTAGPSLRLAKSNQHTSALALVSLVQWAANGGCSSIGASR
jgi:hypothetical protein